MNKTSKYRTIFSKGLALLAIFSYSGKNILIILGILSKFNTVERLYFENKQTKISENEMIIKFENCLAKHIAHSLHRPTFSYQPPAIIKSSINSNFVRIIHIYNCLPLHHDTHKHTNTSIKFINCCRLVFFRFYVICKCNSVRAHAARLQMK